MRQKTKLIALLFASSAFAAVPALAANFDGVARGPAKDMTGSMTSMPNTGTGAGAATANGHVVARSTNKSDNAFGGHWNATPTGSTGESHLQTWNVHNVRVVNVNTLSASGHSDANRVATNITPKDRAELWNSLEANPTVKHELRADSVSRSQVVAANYAGDGTLTVYVD